MRPLITSLVLLLAASLSAQTFNAPSAALNPTPRSSEQVFNKKIFWTEAGAYTLFNVLDGFTTVAHPDGYEEAGFPQGSAYLLGQHPSAARYVATMGAMQVVTSFAAYRLEHSQKRFLRLVGHALMIQGIYAHTDGYIGNVRVLNQGLPQAKLAPGNPPKNRAACRSSSANGFLRLDVICGFFFASLAVQDFRKGSTARNPPCLSKKRRDEDEAPVRSER